MDRYLIALFLGGMLSFCDSGRLRSPIKWDNGLFEHNSALRFSKAVLDDGNTAYLRKFVGNKDIILFLNEANHLEEMINIYVGFFNSTGYDCMVLNYAPHDSVNYSYDEIIRKINSGLMYLVSSGYKSDKIIIYGQGITCHLAVKAALQSDIRGIVIENASNAFFDLIKSDITNLKCPVLIFHGTGSTVGDWHNSIVLYDSLVALNNRERFELKLSIFLGAVDSDTFSDSNSVNDLIRFFPSAMGIRNDIEGQIF